MSIPTRNRRRPPRLLAPLLGAVLCLAASARAAADGDAKPADDDGPKPIAIAKVERATPVDFEKDVLPALTQSCLACHGKAKPKAGLVLETPADIRKGGDNGPAIVAGKADESLLLKASAHQVEADAIMPPAGNKANAPNLTPQQLGLLKLWIDQGATGDVKGPAPIAWRAVPKSLRPAYAVAITPDGRVAAAGRANQIVLYALPDGKEVARLTDSSSGNDNDAAHRDLVQSLAFSPDGQTLASGAYREVKLWRRDGDTWKLHKTFGDGGPTSPLADRVIALQFSPDGGRLATGGGVPSRGGQIHLWNVEAGAIEKSFDEVHTDAVTGLAFGPDGKRLASSAADKFVRITDLETGKVLRSLEGHTHHALGVAWRRDGKGLASVGADNALRFWDAETGERKKVVPGFEKEVTSVNFVGDTDQVLVTAGDGKVKIVKPDGGDARAFAGTTGVIHCAAVTPDGKVVVAGGQDGVVRVWNGADGKLIATLDR